MEDSFNEFVVDIAEEVKGRQAMLGDQPGSIAAGPRDAAVASSVNASVNPSAAKPPSSRCASQPYQKKGIDGRVNNRGSNIREYAEPVYTGDLSRFAGMRPPQVEVKFERSYHRVIAMLASEGHTNKEIAEITGFAPVTISNLLCQPWMQQIITAHLAENSDRVLLELRAEALGAAQRLVDISKDSDVNAETRRKANNDILDRIYGKPNQPMTHVTKNLDDMTDEELLAEYKKTTTN